MAVVRLATRAMCVISSKQICKIVWRQALTAVISAHDKSSCSEVFRLNAEYKYMQRRSCSSSAASARALSRCILLSILTAGDDVITLHAHHIRKSLEESRVVIGASKLWSNWRSKITGDQ